MTIDFSFKPGKHGNKRKSRANRAKTGMDGIDRHQQTKFMAGRMFSICQRCELHPVLKGLVLCKVCSEVLDGYAPE